MTGRLIIGLMLTFLLGPGPAWLAPALVAAAGPEIEVREYKGQKLDPFDRAYDNSIKGPQEVDPGTFRLKVEGLVDKPLALSYEEVLALPRQEKVIVLHCVEGWSEKLLFEGVRLKDLLDLARPKPGAVKVIFWAADGYSSALPLSYLLERGIILAARINGLKLDSRRGFPFQLVAEDKLGYKWVKWVVRLELTDKDYQGFWEQRGYSNEAPVPADRK